MKRSAAFAALALLMGACSPDSDATGSVSSCAQNLYPSYNPKSLDQCVAVAGSSNGRIFGVSRSIDRSQNRATSLRVDPKIVQQPLAPLVAASGAIFNSGP
jgi:hypothetical protein